MCEIGYAEICFAQQLHDLVVDVIVMVDAVYTPDIDVQFSKRWLDEFRIEAVNVIVTESTRDKAS